LPWNQIISPAAAANELFATLQESMDFPWGESRFPNDVLGNISLIGGYCPVQPLQIRDSSVFFYEHR
jgi:hypothetical protein